MGHGYLNHRHGACPTRHELFEPLDDSRVGDRFETSEFVGVAENDLPERGPIDSAVDDDQGPSGGHRLEGWAVRFDDRMPDSVCVDHPGTVNGQDRPNRRLAGSDRAGENPGGLRSIHIADGSLIAVTHLEPAWERRGVRVIVYAAWLALVLGMLISVLSTGGSPTALLATAVGAVWVLTITAVPLGIVRRVLVLDLLAIGGVGSTMASVGLTEPDIGGFLLLSLTPTMYAAMLGGFRTGTATAGLSAAVFVLISVSRGAGTITQSGTMASLYVLVGVTIAYLRRLLIDTEARVTLATATSDAAKDRLASLENAHALLTRLATVTSANDSSPMALGRSALELICAEIPGSSGTAAIQGEEGAILVARYGTMADPHHEVSIPLITGGRTVGSVRIRTIEKLDHSDVERLETALRPLALAFSNALMLQEISHNAVAAERIRLARDLHDDIGPGLASLGLSLDMALLQGASEAELTLHIAQLRERVSELVDEVRTTVTDLRTGGAVTLSTIIREAMAELQATADLLYEVDERRPIRPSLSEPVGRIVGEAMRNAITHAEATNIRVTGWVDFDRGRISIEDDGHGFDPGEIPPGHYGLIGMKERGVGAGIEVDVSSSERGTRVLLEWTSR